MSMTFARIRSLASATRGVVTRTMLLEAGVPEGTTQGWLQRGWLTPIHPGVYRLHGIDDAFRQAVVAASLAVGGRGTISHLTAARLHGLRDGGRGVSPVHVTIQGRSEAALRGVALHQTRRLPSGDVVHLDGVAVTAVGRTLLDCAALVPGHIVREMAADALRRRLVTREALREQRQARPRVRGGRELDDLLDDAVQERLRSWLEAQFVPLIRTLDRAFAVNAPVRDEHGIVIAEADVVFPAERLVIEVDGVRFHATPEEKAHDDRRQNAIVNAGWTVLRYSWDDLRRRPHAVRSQIRRQLQRLDRSA